ncbi:N-acetylmuramoyl-L-alanine amidase [Clostridium culturomicium]|uniref:N-acetylmuramoyl-L-alanine amidase n=1 Tax=Clostridium culturomicium TaxID=1499683 RepID=UPI00385724BE
MYRNLKILIIDVGHGGSDPGAVGNGIVEKVANLNTALGLKAAAEALGIKVFIIRSSDVTQSLEYRVKFANDIARQYPGAQILFVSLHHNAGGGDRAETIHSIYRGEGQRAAMMIADELHKHLGQAKKVYEKVGSDNKDYYYVIRNTSMDAVIVEVAFLDNVNDVQICDSIEEQHRNGQVIACAIGKFFGLIEGCDNDVEAPKPTPPPVVELPKPPTLEEVAVFYRVAVGRSYYDWVKDLEDYAGDKKNPCTLFMAYPSIGELRFRVSPINEVRYYPEVQNYKSAYNNYDEAGVPNVPFDKLQIRFNKPGYKVRYRVMCNGSWLGWVENENSYAEGPNGYAGLGDGTPITAVEVKIVRK